MLTIIAVIAIGGAGYLLGLRRGYQVAAGPKRRGTDW